MLQTSQLLWLLVTLGSLHLSHCDLFSEIKATIEPLLDGRGAQDAANAALPQLTEKFNGKAYKFVILITKYQPGYKGDETWNYRHGWCFVGDYNSYSYFVCTQPNDFRLTPCSFLTELFTWRRNRWCAIKKVYEDVIFGRIYINDLRDDVVKNCPGSTVFYHRSYTTKGYAFDVGSAGNANYLLYNGDLTSMDLFHETCYGYTWVIYA